ncbi:MAG: hypothetical protein ACFFCO_06160 [Promethearchaeota archaeon]
MLVSPSIFALIQFVFEVGVFLPSALLMFKRYRTYRFPAFQYMAIGFAAFLANSVLRLVCNFFAPGSDAFIKILWQWLNFFLVGGIMMLYYSFFSFQERKLPAWVNLVSILGGCVMCAFINLDWMTVQYDTAFSVWNVAYASVVNVFVIPLIIVFVIAFIWPTLSKFRGSKHPKVRRSTAILLMIFPILLLWGLLSGFTANPAIRFIRPFIFTFCWIIWSLNIWRRPLDMVFTDARFERLLVMTGTGLPILLYDFKENALEDPTLISGLFGALTTALEKAIDIAAPLQSIIYQDRLVAVERAGSLVLCGIGDEPDTALMVGLRAFGEGFLERFPQYRDPDRDIGKVTPPSLEEIAPIIDESFEVITIK